LKKAPFRQSLQANFDKRTKQIHTEAGAAKRQSAETHAKSFDMAPLPKNRQFLKSKPKTARGDENRRPLARRLKFSASEAAPLS
jgi:hypothetical protein